MILLIVAWTKAMRIECSDFNYNDSIGMVAFVRSNLCPNGEALHTKVEIGTFCTLNTDDAWYILIAVITMIQSSFSFLSSCNLDKISLFAFMKDSKKNWYIWLDGSPVAPVSVFSPLKASFRLFDLCISLSPSWKFYKKHLHVQQNQKWKEQIIKANLQISLIFKVAMCSFSFLWQLLHE